MTRREVAKAAASRITYHYFNSDTGGVATVAIAEVNGALYYGVSYCDPRDRFVKKGTNGGRMRALRRLIQNIHQGKRLSPSYPRHIAALEILEGRFGETEFWPRKEASITPVLSTTLPASVFTF